MLSSNSSLIYAYQTNLDESMFGPITQAAEVPQYSSVEYELGSVVDLSILNEYWLWDLKAQVNDVKCQWRDKIFNKSFESLPPRLNRQNIEEYLEIKAKELMDILNNVVWDPLMIIIHGKTKSERKANSNRRSNYIGVSKNGPNWQSMISIQKRKAYIGTYQTEREAAIAFDFYSILAHNLDAKTNFSYSKSMISSMIMNFRSNDNLFVPS